jgi:hypothetical protein
VACSARRQLLLESADFVLVHTDLLIESADLCVFGLELGLHALDMHVSVGNLGSQCVPGPSTLRIVTVKSIKPPWRRSLAWRGRRGSIVVGVHCLCQRNLDRSEESEES